jgi:hypothetical protein
VLGIRPRYQRARSVIGRELRPCHPNCAPVSSWLSEGSDYVRGRFFSWLLLLGMLVDLLVQRIGLPVDYQLTLLRVATFNHILSELRWGNIIMFHDFYGHPASREALVFIVDVVE